jgi:uncharacterized protein (TIGR03437 family)
MIAGMNIARIVILLAALAAGMTLPDRLAHGAVISVGPEDSLDAAAAQLQPGDTLLLRNGIYRQRLVAQGLAGTAEAPIVIRGASRNGAIIDGGEDGPPPYDIRQTQLTGDFDFEGMIDLTGCSHVVLSDFTVRNVLFFAIDIATSSYMTVRNVLVDHAGNGGIIMDADHSRITHNVVRWTNQGWLDREGNLQSGDHEGISITGESFDFIVEYNRLHDTLEEAIVVKEASRDGVVRHNVIERAGAVGIYVDEAHRVSVHDNRISQIGWCLIDNQLLSCSNHPLFGVHHFSFPSPAIMLAVGDLEELSQGRLSDIDVYRNVVWQATGDCIELWDQLVDSGTGVGTIERSHIYNNTFWGCGLSGARLEWGTETQLLNNIFAQCTDETFVGAQAVNSTISNNLFHLCNADGQQAVAGDPGLADPAAGDFRIPANSPAVDRGMDVGLATSGAADIGAFEYGFPQILTESATNAASYQGGSVAPGAIMSLFGLDLASQTEQATDTPLPVTLAGVRVELIDSTGTVFPVSLFFVSPLQINFFVPEEAQPGVAALRVVTEKGQGLALVSVEVLAPGVFTANFDGQGVAAAAAVRVDGDGLQTVVPVFDDAQVPRIAVPINLGPDSDQVVLLLFGTGLRGFQSSVEVTIGGEPAQVLGVAVHPDFIGLDQVNVLIPRSMIGRGEVEVRLRADGLPANTVTVRIL